MVFFQSANLVDERPIGKQPTITEEGPYLCLNNFLLERATSSVPGGVEGICNKQKDIFTYPGNNKYILAQDDWKLLSVFAHQAQIADFAKKFENRGYRAGPGYECGTGVGGGGGGGWRIGIVCKTDASPLMGLWELPCLNIRRDYQDLDSRRDFKLLSEQL